jgi:uncharacterized protein with HEPN domain
MPRTVLEYLEHIDEEVSYLHQETKHLAYKDFINDQTLIRAFLKSLEIIGEAAKNVPEHFRRKHPEIEWKTIAGIRSKSFYTYFGVDYEIVWSAVQEQILPLKPRIETIIEETDEE